MATAILRHLRTDPTEVLAIPRYLNGKDAFPLSNGSDQGPDVPLSQLGPIIDEKFKDVRTLLPGGATGFSVRQWANTIREIVIDDVIHVYEDRIHGDSITVLVLQLGVGDSWCPEAEGDAMNA